MSRETRETDIENQEPVEQQAHDYIVALWVRDRVYSSADYVISTFGQASFRLDPKHEPGSYLVIPSRTVDVIKFEKGASRGNQ